MHFISTATLLLSATSTSLAAECLGYGYCKNAQSSSKSALYALRQKICGDTDMWKSAGKYFLPGYGCMKWPKWEGSNAQQVCWDAFQNILQQCIHDDDPGERYNGGSWELNGKQYVDILDNNLLESMDDLHLDPEIAIFQKDNDPKHTSKVASKWLDDPQV